MILESLDLDPRAFEQRTGWQIRPEGACKGDRCIPLPGAQQRVAARALAERLNMPLIQDDATGVWCLGPESGGRALANARATDFELPDLEGTPFRLSSLRGTKILLLAWASW